MTFAPPVAVLQPSNGGLALARTLGRRGLDVEVIATPSDSHTARTRHADGTVLPAFADAPHAWLDALRQRATRGPLALVAGADEATEFLSRTRNELPDSLLTFEARDDAHLPLMNKTLAYELALAAGIKVPLTRSVATYEDLDAVADEMPYPCVLKPVLTHLWRPIFGLHRVLLAHGADELVRHGRQALGADLTAIVSEYVPGGDAHVEEAILVRADDGSFPMQFGCHKLRQSPSGFGAASLCESAPMPESLAMARTLLAHTGFVGVAGIETKRHAETGEYYFIEANVRLPTQFALGDAAGADASWRTYATLARLPLPPRPEPKMGVRLLFPELELAELRRFANGERGPSGPHSWREFVRGYRRIREVGVLDVTDPGPALELAGKSMRRRLRRRFMRARGSDDAANAAPPPSGAD
jgi:D-aspartate ligase